MLRKVLLLVAIFLVFIIVLTLVLAPGITRRYTIKHSKELIGRQIDLEKLKVNYFTGTIRMFNFKLYESNDEDIFVSFDTLQLKLKPFQLFQDELILQQFYLSGLETIIIQDDSTFNFDDLLAFHQLPEDSVAFVDTTESEPFKYQLSNIEFKNARFEYLNNNIGDTMLMRDLSFFIPFIGWNQEEESEADIKFNFENEGYFESSLTMDPNSGDFTAHMIIQRLHLDPFYEYTRDYANLGSLEGILSTDLIISGNTSYPEKAIVSGGFEVFDLKTTDERSIPFVEIEHAIGSLKKIDYFNDYYAFDSLTLINPYFYVEFYDTTINIIEATDYYTYFPPEEETDDPGSTLPSGEIINDTQVPALYYGFDHLAIVNGKMDLVDKTTPEPFSYNLSKIEMSADSIYSDANWVNLYTNMILNDRGKLVAELGFFPEDPMDLSVNYVITDFLLSDLNIYSRHYMGFPILYGDMYYKSETKILNGQLTSDNKLVIHNAEVGDKKGGLYNLPLKFALFLLKDRDGVIDLDIPVRGDLNDPRVSIGKIVWNTFKNLIVKVATAPFDFLARAISVDPKDIKSIEYTYLDTAFTADRQRQIDLLLELEQKKADLEIELVYFNDVEKEKRQIAVDEAGKMFASETGKDYRSDEKEFIGFLQSKTQQDSIDIAQVSQQLVPAETVDSLSSLYNQYRRQTIENYLSLKSDSTAIKIFIPDPQSPKNVASEPRFEVKYSMKGIQPEIE